MTDGTSVGKIYLDVEVSPKSLSAEMNKLSKAFNDSFKGMFSGMINQSNNFVKDSIGRMVDSFKNVAQAGTGSSEKVSQSVDKMNRQYQKTQEEIRKVQDELMSLDAQRDAIIQKYMNMPPLTGMTKDETLEQLLAGDKEFSRLGARIEELGIKMSALDQESNKMSYALSQANMNVRQLTTNTGRLSRFFKIALKHMTGYTLMKRMFTKETQRAASVQSKFGNTMKRVTGMLARRLIVYQLLAKGIMEMARYMWSALKTNEQFAQSLNIIKTNLLVAFQPIYDVVLPALNALMQAVATVTTYVASAISALFGKTYEQSFKAASGMHSAIKGIEGYGKAAKKAGKDVKGALAPFDEINQLMTDAGGDDPDVGGGAGEFEMTMPDLAIVDMSGVEKFKEVMSKLFEPFKLAWKSEGQNVIDAAKYALGEIKELIKAIAKSWMEVWTGGTGQEIIENILKIITNIFNIVGNLAAAFRMAWEKNEVGTRIIQGILDVFNIILGTIEKITGSTAEWAKTLDFTPLLESISTLLEALKPLTENIGAGLAWLWENALLPLAGWVIEDVIPVFLEILAAALGVLNEVIEALKPLGLWLWEEFLQPLAKWTGGVIIKVLEGIRDALLGIGNWIKEHQGIVQGFAVLIGSFATAWGLVNAAIAIWNTVAAIATGVTGGLSAAIAFLGGPVAIAIAIIGSLIAIGVLLYKNWDDISKKAKEIWEKISRFFSETLDKIKKFFTDAWENIKSFLIDKIWNPIKDKAKTTWENIKKVIIEPIQSAWTNLKQIWDNIKKYVLDKWNEIRQGISNMKNNLVNAIKEPFNIAKDWINNLIKDAFNWGKNLISSFVNGIKSMVGKAGDAVRGVAGKVSDFIGFKSPAKEGPGKDADKWMPNLMEMFAAGIQDNIHKVSSAISATAGTIEQNIQFDTHGMADHIGGAISQSLEGLDIDNGNLTVIVKIGEDTITEKVVSNINRQSRISGRTVITV